MCVHKLCLKKAQSPSKTRVLIVPSLPLRIAGPPCRLELCKGNEFLCVPLVQLRKTTVRLPMSFTMSFMWNGPLHPLHSWEHSLSIHEEQILSSPYSPKFFGSNIFLGFTANNTYNFHIWDLGILIPFLEVFQQNIW